MAAPPSRPNPPAPDEIRISAVVQEREGSVYRLRQSVIIDTAEMRLEADEVDFDDEKKYAEARGHVRYVHFARSEVIEADRVEYNVNDETGKFYNVRGTAPAKVESRPGVLTTSNPFSFTCEMAERNKDRYICHHGSITNCKLPNPWWTLRGPVFDIIPDERAIARRSLFWLRGVPLFYAPYFFKSLKRAPRKSGFLTPDFGNSSRRGKWLGTGYFWAINRSYDATYRNQIFTQRGVAHHVDFRGIPSRSSEFNFILYGANDRGLRENRDIKEGGYLMSIDGRYQMPKGFEARADINYLSSFRFRQAWTESFYEAFNQQVKSVGYINRHWSTFSFAGVYENHDNFLSAEPRDRITIRKLPSVEFNSRDRQINRSRDFPVWVSFDSSLAMLRRNQLAFQTRRFVERLDANPRISTAFRVKDINIVPSFSWRNTHWGSSFDERGLLSGDNLSRSSRDFALDIRFPSLGRIYDVKGWFGPKLKHVVEPRAEYRYVSGIDDFSRTIRFDETELLTNTNQVEVAITNRLYTKRSDGQVHEVLSWDLAQQRYFDSDFGGSIVPGQRNVNLTAARLSGFTFFDQRRTYSPLVSSLRLFPSWRLWAEWRADYDPARSGFVNSALQLNTNIAKYSFSVGHNQLRVPWAKANQMYARVGWGQDNRPGWSLAAMTLYDFRVDMVLFTNAQITYNTDCCGVSMQFRRFPRYHGPNLYLPENQFRVALAIANIGSFGTLKRQERF